MRKKTLITVIVLSVVCFPMFKFAMAQNGSGEGSILEELKLYSRALGAILQGYVEEKQPRELFYEAVKGMVSSLDQYSVFFYPEEFDLLQISMKGEYSGIGAKLEKGEHFPVIADIKDDSAAKKVGLELQDEILKVNGESVKDWEVSKVSALLRGDEGTSLLLTIFRKLTNKTFDVTITREKVEIQAVRDVRMIGKSLGYLRIADFQENTAEQAQAALADLHSKGMKALIIDLRMNVGGLLPEAVQLAELFLPEGAKIVTVKSRIPEQRKEYFSSANEIEPFYPIIILVNQGTASASEIFTAAMQDHGRARVVGTRTYGKASVQSVIPLDDKAAMKITTARYVSPNGRVIDKVGIQPDEEVDNLAAGKPGADQQTTRALQLFQEYINS